MPRKKRHSRRKRTFGKRLSRLFSLLISLIFFIVLWSQLSPSTFSRAISWLNPFDVTSSDYDGIDVSKHQGKINWEKVASDRSIKFVYIKATEGRSLLDKRYKTNIAGARKAGLKVGSYHFFKANRTARDQFEHIRKHVRKSDQDLIPMIDVEASGCRGASRAQLQKTLGELMELMRKEYGKYPLVYSQYRFYNEKLAPEFNRYYIFIARYSSKEPELRGGGLYNIWQYSERGRVSGISGHVDLDRLCNGTRLGDIEM